MEEKENYQNNDIILLVIKMEIIINQLKQMKIEYKMENLKITDSKTKKNSKDINIIKIKWIKEDIENLIKKFKNKNILLKFEEDNKYFSICKTNYNNYIILIEYVVKSHVQLPYSLLQYFRTKNRLFYLNKKNEIKNSSATCYNRVYNFYPKWFEEYLSDNYENIISNLIKKIDSFIKKEVNEIEFNNLHEQINKLFFMSFFRNPDKVKQVNEYSTSAKFIENGIKSEHIALICEEMSKDLLKAYKPLIVINTTNENFLTLNCLFSNLYLQNGECIFLSLHPKFGIAMIPNEYYSQIIKEYGNETFIIVNDFKNLRKINMNIHYSAKINNAEIIGIKKDIDILLNELNNN